MATFLLSPVGFCLLALLFAVSHTQLPLYSWDQNTYFLHGLAEAGWGYLAADPLARTADPMPAFSLLVRVTYRAHAAPAFYFYQVVILGVYLYGLVEVARRTARSDRDSNRVLALVTLLVLIHSSLARAVSVALFRMDVFAPLTTGVGAYGVIGLVFQASTFSAFLILSVALFLRGRTLLAVLAIALAATVHPTYLLSGAALTFSYMVAIYREKRGLREPVFVGVLALLLVLPITVYVFRNFGSTSEEIAHRAFDIIVNYRIPHHAAPRVWFGPLSVVQMLIMIGALVLVRKTRLYTVLLVTLLVGTLLTLVQIATGDLRLALISPWRVSVVLIPISTACIVARIVDVSSTWLADHRRATTIAFGILLAAAVTGGIVSTRRKFVLRANDPARRVTEYVTQSKVPGALYLVPVDMQGFRLATGAPVFVDHKAFPYRDVEILAWYERLQLAQQFYGGDSVDCALVERLAAERGVTHVLVPSSFAAPDSGLLEARYGDAEYRVYAIRWPSRD